MFQACRIVFYVIYLNIFRQLLTTIFNLLIGQLSNSDERLLPHAIFGS